ncbi:MAG TPA: hypothetical protein PKN48_10670 [Bacteroidales bacterium]|nr:hypothetical protein [Bacteroidales bacterium]
MIAEYYINRQGKLSLPLIKLFSSLMNLPEHRLAGLIIGFNASRKNMAETWGTGDIRIQPHAYEQADAAEWIGTLAHELTHEYQYFKSIFPDCLIRFFDQFGIKFREWILRMPHEKAYKASRMEKQAFTVQAVIMDFVRTYSPQKVLADNTLSEQEKVELVLKMSEEYKSKKMVV